MLADELERGRRGTSGGARPHRAAARPDGAAARGGRGGVGAAPRRGADRSPPPASCEAQRCAATSAAVVAAAFVNYAGPSRVLHVRPEALSALRRARRHVGCPTTVCRARPAAAYARTRTPLRPRSRSGRENCPGAGGAGADRSVGAAGRRRRRPGTRGRNPGPMAPGIDSPQRVGRVRPGVQAEHSSTGRLATEMRAAQITALGEPPNAADVDEPRAGDGETLVDVLASALNPHGAAGEERSLIRRPSAVATRQGPRRRPRRARGRGRARSGHAGLRSGRRAGVTRDGGLAGRVARHGGDLPLPIAADFGLAAALGIFGRAGWLPLAWRAPVRADGRVLVLGATGIVGLVAVQAARLIGAARVVAAGRDPESRSAPLRRAPPPPSHSSATTATSSRGGGRRARRRPADARGRRAGGRSSRPRCPPPHGRADRPRRPERGTAGDAVIGRRPRPAVRSARLPDVRPAEEVRAEAHPCCSTTPSAASCGSRRARALDEVASAWDRRRRAVPRP